MTKIVKNNLPSNITKTKFPNTLNRAKQQTLKPYKITAITTNITTIKNNKIIKIIIKKVKNTSNIFNNNKYFSAIIIITKLKNSNKISLKNHGNNNNNFKTNMVKQKWTYFSQLEEKGISN